MLSIEKKDLLEALLKVGKAIDGKNAIPELQGVLIEIENQKLTLKGSNLDISIETEIKLKHYTEDSKILTDYKMLLEITKRLPEGIIRIIHVEGTTKDMININMDKIKFSIPNMEVDNYPYFEKIKEEDTAKIQIAQSDFKDLVNKVYFAASLDETRPILKGTLIEVKDKKLSLVALDGFRVSVANLDVSEDFEANVVCDTKYLVEISKILGMTGIVDIRFTKNKILFKTDNTTTLCRLMEGSFINYHTLIDPILPQIKYKFDINRAEILSAIDRSILFSKGNDGKNLIKFTFTDEGKLFNITSRSNVGNSNETLELTNPDGFEGNFEIAFNARYITDILKHLLSDEVTFLLSSNVSPCIITRKDVPTSVETFLVLPVRLNLVK